MDMIKIGDDLGTQENLMISPRMYRKMLKPLHAEMIALIKQKTKAKVFFHTDGDVFDLIDDFIEIGVDILNPIQTSAGKMSNLEELKKNMINASFFAVQLILRKSFLRHSGPGEARSQTSYEYLGSRWRLYGCNCSYSDE